ncbi:MAG: phosphoribosylamine--glycine ligase [Candidatus Wallbacteria bacterium]|nr:phosphoribosylamine--glycine ligase [Candidatus Wallbacteria bacterium]
MRILVLGRGGREHAIVWKVSRSPLVKKIYCATGNSGIAELAELVDIKAEDINGLLKFAEQKKIDLTLVGPEVSLTEGIVDLFHEHGLKILGPTKNVARLEGSKAFAKRLMMKYDIPTARFGAFSDEQEAFKYIEKVGAPLVVRADGLSAGKGIIIAKDEITAKLAVNVMIKDRIFGDAGRTVVLEEYLMGQEISCFLFIHKNKVLSFTTCEDYKRAYDGNRGPNTGGMGAFSPSNKVDAALEKKIEKEIFKPVITAMKKEGMEYSGVMFVSLILSEDGTPKVTEFNLRFNDPLTQVVLPRLNADLVEVVLGILNDDTKKLKIEWDKRSCLNVVGVSEGYPLKYSTGHVITGLDKVSCSPDLHLFHAGTKNHNGNLVTGGGRVFDITSIGKSIEEARKKVYEEIKKVCYSGIHYRKDIGI